MMLSYRSAHAKHFFTNVLGMKRAAVKIVPKIVEQNLRHIDIAQEMLATFNGIPDLLGTNHGRMSKTLKPKPNHSNGSVQNKS